MKIITAYDPNMAANMMRQGMSKAADKANETDDPGDGTVKLDTNVDTGQNVDTDFGNLSPKLEGFSKHSPNKFILNVLLLGLITMILLKYFKENIK